MFKVKVVLIAVIVCAISMLSACGGNEEGQNNPTETPKANSAQSTPEAEDKKDKSNAEKFLDYAIDVADKRNFTETGDYAGVLNSLYDFYKDDIVNPHTGGKSLYAMNRTRSFLKKDNMVITRGVGVDCVVIDDYMTLLEKIDTSEVVYCVNPESKGMVIAFWLMDGVYIYEVDENGEKINEIEHFFEKE